MYILLQTFIKETATFNSIFGILLYWVPLSICVFGYTLRTFNNYQGDVKDRSIKGTTGKDYYYPTDRYGDLIGRFFASIIPVVNLWTAMFDVSPRLFSKFFRFIGDFFDKPLVPKRKPE